jgi:hypothetical protein
METKLDIGIGFDDTLEILIPRQSKVPFKTANHIKVSNLGEDNRLLLHVYEGICIQNKYNHLMKTFELNNVREGLFLIQFKLLEKENRLFVRVMADDIILDDLECTETPELWTQNKCEEDDKKREWIHARNMFIEFVDNAIQFLSDKDVRKQIRNMLQTTEDNIYFEEMNKQLKDASKIIETCDDVTKEEYVLMLEEISQIVNPFISRIQKIVKREKIN